MTDVDKVKVIVISMLCYILYVILSKFNKWKKKIKKDRLKHNHSTTNTCVHKHDGMNDDIKGDITDGITDDIIHVHNLRHEHIFDDTNELPNSTYKMKVDIVLVHGIVIFVIICIILIIIAIYFLP